MNRVARPAIEVVNFEELNYIPPQDGLIEQRAEIISGMQNIWYEYVPKSYDKTRKVPLVVQLHGGGQDGRRWANYTIWHKLADKYGFIVIYPNSPDYGVWNCDKRDVQYLYDLINHICNKYSIDRSRIYMQGMSNGDMMTLAFSMEHPEILAAAGFITGPSPSEALDGDMPKDALPIIQMRGELDVNWRLTPETVDVFANRYYMNDLNREIWEQVNGTENMLPILSIQGKDNFLVFQGRNAPTIIWEVQGMGHREPAYSAQVLWDRLYSGCSRVNGKICVENPIKPIEGDDDTILISLGSNKAYRKNGMFDICSLKHGVVRVMLPMDIPHFCPVKLGEMCETEVMCAPVEFFNRAYGADIKCNETGETGELTFPNGMHVVLQSRSLLVIVNGEYRAMQKPCLLLGGILYVPVGELCQMLFNKFVSIADDVMCISDHYAVLGRYTASIIRRLLGGTMRPRTKPTQ